MPKLTWTAGGERKSVDVTDSCSIGRVPENTVALADEAGASRRHCQILKIKDGFELADLGSTNGTKVNGAAVKRHKLREGDEIRIGETVLVWSEGSGADAGAEEEILLEEPAGAPSGGGGGGGAQASDQCFLVYAGGPRDGEKVPLDRKRVTFGRNPKNTFVLDDAMASGYHCEIAREGGTWLLRDLGSTNGTLVDGEPVTETALAHGARLRIGGTRLVFLDPTVSDFEKAMSAVEDLGSEWGLLRAEMDLTRVQKARRSQAVAIVGVLVLLGGAGYVAVAHPELLTSAPQPLTKVDGNLAGEDFSFEQLSAAWTTPPGSPAKSRFADASDGAAAQGTSFYAVSREGAPGRAAFVQRSDAAKVNPSSSYALGAKVRAKDGGQAVVRAAWFAADGTTLVGRSSTDAVGAGAWTEARRVVTRPPRDAALVRIELANFGTGTAYFDDVVLVPCEPGRDVELKDDEVSWRVTTDAQATLSRGTATLLLDLAPVGGALAAAVGDEAGRPDRVGGTSGVALTESGARGQVLEPAGPGGAFELSGKPAESRYLELDAKLPKDAALVGRLAAEFVDEGIGVLMATNEYVRVSDVRIMDKVRSVTFGDSNQFKAAARDESTFRFALLRTEEGWLAAFGADGETLALRIDTDSRALKAEVEEIADAATVAENMRRLGIAVQKYSELAGRLPAGNARGEEARTKATNLDRAGRDRLEALVANVSAAIQYEDDAGLAVLADEAAALAAEYAKHPVEAGAGEQSKLIADAEAKRRSVVAERRAKPFLSRGQDYEARGSVRLAEAVYRGIVDAYPGTESAKEAQAGLSRLQAGK